jgi:hypothetical protein
MEQYSGKPTIMNSAGTDDTIPVHSLVILLPHVRALMLNTWLKIQPVVHNLKSFL